MASSPDIGLMQGYLRVGTPDDSIKKLIGDISQVSPGGKIHIFCGEGNPDVYGDGRFEEITRKVLMPPTQAEMFVSTAPILIEQNGSHPFLRLQEDKSIASFFHLRHRKVRSVHHHFRVVQTADNFIYYEEFPHLPGAETNGLAFRDTSRFHQSDIDKLSRWAISLTRIWDMPDMPVPSTHLVSAVGIARLMDEVKKHTGNPDLDYMEIEYLLKLPSGKELLNPYNPR